MAAGHTASFILQQHFFSRFGGFIDGGQDFNHVDTLLRHKVGCSTVLHAINEMGNIGFVTVNALELRFQIGQNAVFFGIHFDLIRRFPRESRFGAAQFHITLFNVHIGCPTEFDLQAGTVVKTDKAHGKIFHARCRQRLHLQ